MNAAYRTVAARIRSELSELHRVVQRTLQVWQRARQVPDDYLVDAAALNLHGFYAGTRADFRNHIRGGGPEQTIELALASGTPPPDEQRDHGG